jgi:hypothetical protein
MIIELTSLPARIGWQYPVVHTVIKHSCHQVGSWIFVSTFLSGVDASQQYAMMMSMEVPYHHICQGLGSTFSNLPSKSSAAAS